MQKRQHVWELRLKSLGGHVFFILAPTMQFSAAAKVAERFMREKHAEILTDHGSDLTCQECRYGGADSYAHKADGRGNYDKHHKVKLEILRLEWKGPLDWPAVSA